MTYYSKLKNLLLESGVESAAFDARNLLCHVLQFDQQTFVLHRDLPLDEAVQRQVDEMAQKRIAGYPLQYLIGTWEFYGLPFCVGEGVLIPRADTETLCDAAIACIGGEEKIVIDLCSGTGCIAVAVQKSCPQARVYAVEKYDKAFGFLKHNIALNRSAVTAVQGDVFEKACLEKLPMCDVITANPPYLTAEEMKHLQKEVTFEPETALLGASDGLCFYRQIAKMWFKQCRPGGTLLFEIGVGQHDAVTTILIECGWKQVAYQRDINGIVRVLSGTKPTEAETTTNQWRNQNGS